MKSYGLAILLASFAAGGVAEEVTLQTATGAIHGTLLLPAGSPPYPLVIILSGSGPTDRDGNSSSLPGPNDSLKMFAEGLGQQGIASLRYDKRGVGASVAAGPSESDLRFEMYVEDAVAWGSRFATDPRFRSITFAGHSEGSLIALLASQRISARATISIAGAGRRAGDLILAQLAPQVSPELLAQSRAIVESLNAGNLVSTVPLSLYALFRPSVQPYLISWFRYDPAAEASKLDSPLLVLQGTTDLQVTADDARVLASAAQRATLVLIPGMNHVLKDVGGDAASQLPSYSDPGLPIDPTLVRAAAQFVNARSRRRALR